MTQPILIAIAGKLGSGKTEIVHILKRIHGERGIGVIKISQPIYDLLSVAQELLNLPPKKDRLFLQLIGTEWGRKTNPDIWINKFIENVDKIKNYYDVLICDDLRFLNEFHYLKERRFILVKIERPEELRKKYEGTGSLKHSSETELDSVLNEKFDFYIENNSSYDDLVYKVSEMFMDIKENNI